MKQLLLAMAIAAAATSCATTTSPTGRTQQVGAVSQAELNQLGARAFAEAKASNRQSSDAGQTRYVRCVVDAITRQLPAQWQANWESALFVEESPNAFALPGGKVGIHTGIFSVARNQDQLAAVIAHERAHLRERHHIAVAVAAGLARAFPLVPLFTAAANEIARLVEMRADDAAARDTDQISVAAALVALAGMRAPRAALAAADTAGAMRVMRLLEPAVPVGLGRRVALVAALTLLLLAPALLAAYPAFAAAGADICTAPPLRR
ncbi:MAG: M48 family metalloprotease [Proteobacteria bacterium]|nr:M48 family metalloprotease [Pseudomonadota bacterium]